MKKLLFYYPDNGNGLYRVSGYHDRLTNTENIMGNCTYIHGNAQNLTGNVTGFHGDVSGLSGDASKSAVYSPEVLYIGDITNTLYADDVAGPTKNAPTVEVL
jgi:hypothetical protein